MNLNIWGQLIYMDKAKAKSMEFKILHNQALVCFPILTSLFRPPLLHTSHYWTRVFAISRKHQLFPYIQAFVNIISSAWNTPPPDLAKSLTFWPLASLSQQWIVAFYFMANRVATTPHLYTPENCELSLMDLLLHLSKSSPPLNLVRVHKNPMNLTSSFYFHCNLAHQSHHHILPRQLKVRLIHFSAPTLLCLQIHIQKAPKCLGIENLGSQSRYIVVTQILNLN